jgi:hypothetical protein
MSSAKAKPTPATEQASASVIGAVDGDQTEWETIYEESPTTVIMDAIGDTLIGTYEGVQHIEPMDEKTGQPSHEPFDRFLFRGHDGDLYALNSSYQLRKAIEDVKIGSVVKITLSKFIETNRKQNPLKDYRIQVAKSA